MFDLPDAKRVRREDLYASDDDDDDDDVSPSDNEALVEIRALVARNAALQAQLARVFGPIDIDIPHAAPAHDSAPKHDTNAADREPQEAEAEAFEFRLFATSSETAAPAQKIVIDDPPEPELGEGAFVVPQRVSSWYFTEPATGRRREEFESVVVRGEDVLCHQRDRAWGLEVPWRVRVIKISKKEANILKLKGGLGNAVVGMAEEKTKRTKPNKKRRIVLRMEKRAKEEKEEARRKQREQEKIRQAEKEKAVEEKKRKMNRKKQIKRRAKAKAAKMGEGGGDLADGVDDDHGGGEDKEDGSIGEDSD